MLVCYRPLARRGAIFQPKTSAPAVARPGRKDTSAARGPRASLRFTRNYVIQRRARRSNIPTTSRRWEA